MAFRVRLRVITMRARSVLYIIACGGRPAGDLPEFVRHPQDHGWNVCVIATPSGMKFLDPGLLASLTGHPVRCEYKRPGEPDVLPLLAAYLSGHGSMINGNAIS